MDQTKDIIYLAALLHDVGKFIERAKNQDWQNDTDKYVRNKETSRNHGHRRYSALFVEKYLKDKEFLAECLNSVHELILHHHNDNRNEVENFLSIDDRGVLQKIIRIADDLASSEREKDETLDPEKYYLVNLEAPFNDIIIKSDHKEEKLDVKKYLYPSKLCLHFEEGNHRPHVNKLSSTNKYENLVKDFLLEVENIENEDALLALMEKYLSQVPAQTPTEFGGKKYLYKPDINLYDHSRTVAAIAVVLYEEWKNGSYKGKENDFLLKNYQENLKTNPAILICGNVNGIQDFIFDVTTKRAAKNLKGRSYFIQLLTDIVSKDIVNEFSLKEANILYNGGGNFFILAPNYRKNDIEKIQKKIAENLLNTKLYLSIGFAEVSFDVFDKNFGNAFDRAVKSSNEAKKKKFCGLHYQQIFEPFPQRLKGEGKYHELSVSLQNANGVFIGHDNKEPIKEDWEKLFRKYGFQVKPMPVAENKIGLVYNTAEFAKDYSGFCFTVKDLPKLNESIIKILDIDEKYLDEDEKLDSILQFKRYTQLSINNNLGTKKLGVLKMDIDNLGKIFQDGLKNPTIGRIAYLSRSLKWFFEGYMNTILQSVEFKDRIYPIFSGGDDFFVVGAWNKVFDFATKVRQEFRVFVCNHPRITLSASLLVVDENYPVTQIAKLAEERLDDAKSRKDIKSDEKIKNAVSVFDTVLSWDDFEKARELKEIIKQIIDWNHGNRAIINKIQKSSSGFAAIQKEILFNKVIKFYKVWRLNYYLRDLKNVSKSNPNKEKIENAVKKIVERYETLFFEAFKGNATSIQIFPVAARWAELETRKN